MHAVMDNIYVCVCFVHYINISSECYSGQKPKKLNCKIESMI